MNDFHENKIKMINEEDFSGVRRKVAEDHWREFGFAPEESYLDEGIDALKVYYVLALVDPLNEHAVSDEIDRFWHAHILHTRQYRDFCERVFGQYIDHDPLDHSVIDDVEYLARLYKYTMNVYWDISLPLNQTFFPNEVPDRLLVCKHQRVLSPEITKNALYAPVEV
jgi:hypothetical protein